MREITGGVAANSFGKSAWHMEAYGAFYADQTDRTGIVTEVSEIQATQWARLKAGRVVPTGLVTRPRSLAVLACAYMGTPAL